MSAFRLHSVSGGGNNPTLYQQPLCEREFGVRAALLMSAGVPFGGSSSSSNSMNTSNGNSLNNSGNDINMRRGQVLEVRPYVIAKNFNNFVIDDRRVDAPLPDPLTISSSRMKQCKPFVIAGFQLGLITPEVEEVLKEYAQVFVIKDQCVTLVDTLNTYDSRTKAVAAVLKDMRSQDKFLTLRGWRDEFFEVRINTGKPSIMRMERAATCIFGIRQFGVDINGFVNHPEKGLCIWLQKRSDNKQRWPGMWDNMVSGGLSVGFSVSETAQKEANEEASIPEDMVKDLELVKTISIFFESERGLSPNTEFIHDLELPLNFIPRNQDGEVSEFQLLTAREALDMVLSPKFKTTSCPVALDFLIRRGVLTDEMEPELERVKQLLQIPLLDFYRKLDE